MTNYRRLIARTDKALHDTVAGCRIRAEADLLASVTMLTVNQRRRLETSASSWAARADLLQRENDELLARKVPAKSAPLRS